MNRVMLKELKDYTELNSNTEVARIKSLSPLGLMNKKDENDNIINTTLFWLCKSDNYELFILYTTYRINQLADLVVLEHLEEEVKFYNDNLSIFEKNNLCLIASNIPNHYTDITFSKIEQDSANLNVFSNDTNIRSFVISPEMLSSLCVMDNMILYDDEYEVDRILTMGMNIYDDIKNNAYIHTITNIKSIEDIILVDKKNKTVNIIFEIENSFNDSFDLSIGQIIDHKFKRKTSNTNNLYETLNNSNVSKYSFDVDILDSSFKAIYTINHNRNTHDIFLLDDDMIEEMDRLIGEY